MVCEELRIGRDANPRSGGRCWIRFPCWVSHVVGGG